MQKADPRLAGADHGIGVCLECGENLSLTTPWLNVCEKLIRDYFPTPAGAEQLGLEFRKMVKIKTGFERPPKTKTTGKRTRQSKVNRPAQLKTSNNILKDMWARAQNGNKQTHDSASHGCSETDLCIFYSKKNSSNNKLISTSKQAAKISKLNGVLDGSTGDNRATDSNLIGRKRVIAFRQLKLKITNTDKGPCKQLQLEDLDKTARPRGK